MNKKITLSVIIVALIVISGAYLHSRSVNVNNKTTIGAILPLSGNMSFIGEDFKNGLDLATISEPNITMSYEDNKGTIKDEVSAYQKLQSIIKPNVIISAGIGDLAVIPLAEKDKIPLMLSVSSASGLPAMGEYIFRYFTNADLDAPVMADYAVNKLGLRKIAILYLQDQFGLDYKDIFSKQIIKDGGKIVGQESFQYSDFDYKTQISKLKNTGFDSIYLIGLDYQLVTAIKQIRELGIKSQILSIGTVATKDSISKAGDSINNTYVTAFCVDGIPEKYVTEFKQKYNSNPGFFSELGYDIGKMIISAIKESGSSKEDIKNGLSKIHDFPTNTGLVSADKYGEMTMPVCVKKITDEKIYNTATGNYSDF
jgi:branched-chain amino acid transport system substrate-binding protein